MAKRPPKGYWDIEDDTGADNIAAILDHLRRYTDAPAQAIAILTRALAERDAALADVQRRLADDGARDADKPIRRVDMKPTDRKGYSRDVPLIERQYVCRHCLKTFTYMAYPSAALKTVCDDPACQEAEQERLRLSNAERQKRYRERQKAIKGGNPR
ncbi:MAG: FmdB family zinc ribbon protein [Aggregatilineales bacterium]